MLNKIMQCTWTNKYGDFSSLVLRLALGVIFLWHGYDKVFVKGLPAITGFLGTLGFPTPSVFALILSYGELVSGTLLIIGLFTHWAAKFTTVVSLVAFFTVHMKNGFAVGDGGYEFIILIFAASVSILFNGVGKYSVDAMWRKGGNVCNMCNHAHSTSSTCECGCCKK